MECPHNSQKQTCVCVCVCVYHHILYNNPNINFTLMTVLIL